MDQPIKTEEVVRRKFGLDFLPSPSTPSESSGASTLQKLVQTVTSSIDPGSALTFAKALLTQGGTAANVLTAISESNSKRDQIYNIVDRSRLDFDIVIRIVDQLSVLGFVSYLSKDSRGNHTVQLTERGQALIGLLGVANRLLKALNDAPNQEKAVYDLVDETRLEFDVVINLADQLNVLGLIEYIKKDSRGNHLIHLTESGISLLK